MPSRRAFLRNSGAVISLAALAPTLKAESLDSIKTAFAKADHMKPGEAAKDETLWAEVQNAFNLNPNFVNLGSVVRGVAPQLVSDAVIDTYARINEYRIGGNYFQVAEKWEAIRQRLALHAGCAPEELTLTRNTTDGITTVIAGLKMKAGDEIITTTQEHNPYYGTLYQRAARDRLKVRCVPLPTPAETATQLVEAVEKAITSRTRLIVVCHVYLSGQIFPVRRLCDTAHRRGIKVLADGALAFGHIPVNVKALDCDFYATSFHKWGCGPAATGFFYAKREHIAGLPPLYGYFDHKTHNPAFDSDRIDKFGSFGTHPRALFLSIGQMLDFHEAIGGERIQARLDYLKRYWAEQLQDEKKLKLLASPDPQSSCALLSFDVNEGKRQDVTQPLWQRHNILLGGAYIEGEFGKPETWREITLCNTALFTRLVELDRFVVAMKEVLQG